MYTDCLACCYNKTIKCWLLSLCVCVCVLSWEAWDHTCVWDHVYCVYKTMRVWQTGCETMCVVYTRQCGCDRLGVRPCVLCIQDNVGVRPCVLLYKTMWVWDHVCCVYKTMWVWDHVCCYTRQCGWDRLGVRPCVLLHKTMCVWHTGYETMCGCQTLDGHVRKTMIVFVCERETLCRCVRDDAGVRETMCGWKHSTGTWGHVKQVRKYTHRLLKGNCVWVDMYTCHFHTFFPIYPQYLPSNSGDKLLINIRLLTRLCVIMIVFQTNAYRTTRVMVSLLTKPPVHYSKKSKMDM